MIIKEFKLDKASLATAGGIKPQTVSGYINDGRLPNQRTLELWLREFKVDGTWLLTGEGEMFAESEQSFEDNLPLFTKRLMDVEQSMGKAARLAKLEAMKAVIEGEIEDEKNIRLGDREQIVSG